MFVSIITINRNNADGLEKTLDSVNYQSAKEFEHIIIDGASTDGSVDVIKRAGNGGAIRTWLSEPDTGIYNAMNKGIRMATGDYIMILNSGDCLADDSVIEGLLKAVDESGRPDFIYGNMIKVWPDGLKYKHSGEDGHTGFSMLDFYKGTLDHDGALIKRSLYGQLGYYDESLKICSDWKWVMMSLKCLK